MFDAVIVGARCAGSLTGMLLAENGRRVLLVDKASFPSDTLSTHMIHESGVARLRRLRPELVDRIRASNCPPLASSMTDVGDFAYGAEHYPIDGNAEAFCPRRTVLDPMLAAAAVQSGCELRTDFVFQDVVREGDRVVGIRGRSGKGTEVIERAAMVIGADGRRSSVASAVGAKEYATKPKTTCTYYTYWADTGFDQTIISPREGRAIVAVPTNDRLAVITAIFPVDDFARIKGDAERHYLETLQLSPSVVERTRDARRAERLYGTGDLPFYYRTAFGPGWALVGDAGHCKDPIIARGISDAFRDAEMLARAILRGTSGEVSVEEALGDWARERDEATRDIYEFTYRLSLLAKTTPLMARVYEEARTNKRIGARFHGVISGALRYREFFVSDDADEVIRVNS